MIQPEPVVGRPRETALVVAVPEAEPAIAAFRARFDSVAVAKRIPPHVTLLYPFVPANELDPALLQSLRELYKPVRPFDFQLTRVDRFDHHVWLAPDPRNRFVELIELTCARFPAYPSYGERALTPEPHLTIGTAEGDRTVEATAAVAKMELATALPLRCRAERVSLLEEQAEGTWAVRTTTPFTDR